jgi:hypothetical protein
MSFALISTLAVASSAAPTTDLLFKFDGAIAVTPVSQVLDLAGNPGGPDQGEVVENLVRGHFASKQPWRIASLHATVRTDGTIQVQGSGLLLAGGNHIGTSQAANVRASLVCGLGPDANARFESFTSFHALTDDGVFSFDEVLPNFSFLPNPCVEPALIIWDANTARWLAASILVKNNQAQ